MVLFQLLRGNKWHLQLGDIKGAFLEAGLWMLGTNLCLQGCQPAGGIPGATADQLVEVIGNVYGQNGWRLGTKSSAPSLVMTPVFTTLVRRGQQAM